MTKGAAVRSLIFLLAGLLSCALDAQIWQQTNGPFGGTVNCIAIDTNGVILIGTDGGGVFRSLDNGDTWMAANNGITSKTVLSICIAPNQQVFAGTEDGSIFKSLDAGTSWTQAASGLSSVTALRANSIGTIFAGLPSGAMLRSSDDGLSWPLVGLAVPQITGIAVNAGDTLFASGNYQMPPHHGVYRSVDNGDTWTQVYGVSCLSLAINSNGDLFAGLDYPWNPGGVVRSMDNGATWLGDSLSVGTAITCLDITSAGEIFAGQRWGGVLRSSDNGATWQVSNLGTGIQPLRALAVNAVDHVFAGLSFSRGMFRSTDSGSTWSEINNGLIASHVHALAVNSSDHYFAGTWGHGMFRSMDGGGTWQEINNGLEGSCIETVLINSNGDLFALAGEEAGWPGIYRSLDNGDNWSLVTDSVSPVYVLSMSINSTGHLFASWANHGLLRSTDNGDTWAQINTGSLGTGAIVRLAANSSGHLFGANLFGVIRSTDGGVNWTQQVNGITPSNSQGMFIAISQDDALFATTLYNGYHLYRSIDNADNWIDLTSDLPNAQVQAMAFPGTPGNLIAGTTSGALQSWDYGDAWWPMNNGLTSLDIRSLAIDQSGSALAGTKGGGVFRTSLPVSVKEPAVVGDDLEQNAPNPASDITTIRYHLAVAARVSLEVMDVQGRVVARSERGAEPAGPHAIAVDVSTLEGGVYFYSLVANGRPITKRMIVAR